MKQAKSLVLWAVQLLLAVVMIGPGVQKFTAPVWERMFRAWGYPDGFYIVIGAIEIVCGAGLLIPKTVSASAVILAIVMFGAALTQMLAGGRNGVGELVFATLLSGVAYFRWRGF